MMKKSERKTQGEQHYYNLLQDGSLQRTFQDDSHQAIQYILFQILERINELDIKLNKVISSNTESAPHVIIIEQMDKDTVKNKVIEYIKKEKISDIAELHKEIKCDIRMLIEVLDELISEGKIGEAIDAKVL